MEIIFLTWRSIFLTIECPIKTGRETYWWKKSEFIKFLTSREDITDGSMSEVSWRRIFIDFCVSRLNWFKTDLSQWGACFLRGGDIVSVPIIWFIFVLQNCSFLIFFLSSSQVSYLLKGAFSFLCPLSSRISF